VNSESMIAAGKISGAERIFQASLPTGYSTRKRFRPRRTTLNLLVAVLVGIALGSLSPAPRVACAAGPFEGVLTHHYDNQRTGAIVSETMLTTANVNTAAFGKRFTDPVDAQIYAEPLYVANVSIPNQGTHNVVYIATENDSVYAFDADTGGPPLWQRSFLSPGVTPIPSTDTGCTQIVPIIGITATPVIDSATGTIYVVAQTKENGTYVHRLHALDITTGGERSNRPVVISPTAQGSGGTITFDTLRQKERAALLLVGNTVYLGASSHCDIEPYHGWLVGFDKSSLNQTAVFNTTPDGSEAAIWNSDGGPSADAEGQIYVSTGNGTFDANTGGPDYGDSFIKLDPSALGVLDYFTPFNQAMLSDDDLDLGSGALMLLPDQPGANPHLAVSGGKGATLYLVNRDNLGKFNNTTDQILGEISGQIGPLFGTPTYFNGRIYIISSGQPAVAFDLVNGNFASSAPSLASSIDFTNESGTPVISANGTTNPILWAIDSVGGTAVLRAFDANDLATELYDSEQNPARDLAGNYVKFTVPTVINGKVYVGADSQLSTYGLLAEPSPPPSAQVAVIESVNSKIRPNHTINGGVFQLTNTATSPETLTSVTLGFSSPSLFSAAQLAAKLHGVGSSALVTTVSSASVFTLGKALVVSSKKAVKFHLQLTGAKATGLSASSQSVVAVSAGANVSGLPAALGQVVPK
jgi:hypothetical protein